MKHLLFTVVSLLILVCDVAFGCNGTSPDIKMSFERADIVAIGIVVSLKLSPKPKYETESFRVTAIGHLNVEEFIKGSGKKRLKLIQRFTFNPWVKDVVVTNSCDDQPMHIGQRFIVFYEKNRPTEYGRFTVTMPWEFWEEYDLEALRALSGEK